MGTWVKPTGFIDSGSVWTNEPLAWDPFIATGADTVILTTGWSAFLELTISALDCDSIKYVPHTPNPGEITLVDVDVYYSGSYHHVYQGSFVNTQWVERSLGGEYSVSKIRFSFYNSNVSAFGAQVNSAEFYGTFTPNAPTNVVATDGVHTNKIVITWTKSAGATNYDIYRNENILTDVGDVAIYNYTGDAPVITPGTAEASDGTNTALISLSLIGQSINDGRISSYKIKAKFLDNESPFSNSDTGYRTHGALIYQWQKSSADGDADYSNIGSATSASYDDTNAPVNREGRYYRCVLNATGASQVITNVDRGVRAYPYVTTQIPTDIIRADPSTVTANALIAFDVGETITTRGFKYGETETDEWDEFESDSYSEGVFSLQLTLLDEDTTYYIQAYAIGAWGTTYGAWLEFITAYPYGANKVEVKSVATASASDIAAVGGKRTLTIENHLIQNQTIADIISAAYLAKFKDQKTKLVITKPCPAPYTIGDTVERGAGIHYAPAASAVIHYAPAASAVIHYELAPHKMLIRKLNISFSAGNYTSVIELESP